MKGKLILWGIISYTVISRFFLIDKIPPMFSPDIVKSRYFSAVINILSLFIFFHLVKIYSRNAKIAYLSSWVFSILPWIFEQGRIKSAPNLALGLILLFIFSLQRIHSKIRFILLVFIPFIIFLAYPQFWIFRAWDFRLNAYSFITNLFILSSFDFLFFKNVTFWWGGIKDFGVMLLTFAPFFTFGVYQLVISKKGKILMMYGSILIIAALSPFFPESREFFFITPLVSYIVALGIYQWLHQENAIVKVIFSCLFIIMIYEIVQFFHFYFVHYPQQIFSNFSQIHETF